MELLLNKSLLEELYNCRKEDFEELIYKKYRKKIKPIENETAYLKDEFMELIKENITNDETFDKINDIFNKYDYSLSDQIDFWNLAYYQLGMADKEKLKEEISNILK